jgi:hypothetical protein
MTCVALLPVLHGGHNTLRSGENKALLLNLLA